MPACVSIAINQQNTHTQTHTHNIKQKAERAVPPEVEVVKCPTSYWAICTRERVVHGATLWYYVSSMMLLWYIISYIIMIYHISLWYIISDIIMIYHIRYHYVEQHDVIMIYHISLWYIIYHYVEQRCWCQTHQQLLGCCTVCAWQ